jgi:hypothetical protein
LYSISYISFSTSGTPNLYSGFLYLFIYIYAIKKTWHDKWHWKKLRDLKVVIDMLEAVFTEYVISAFEKLSDSLNSSGTTFHNFLFFFGFSPPV